MSRALLITVSGSCAGVGKTRLIERLLPCLGYCAAVKARCCGEGDDGEAARARVEAGPGAVVEQDGGGDPRKDTGRFLAAGACAAFLITGRPGDVRREIEKIIAGGGFDCVVVESNAMALALESDLSFFVRGPGPPKPTAPACEARADIAVCGVTHRETDSRAQSE